MVGAKVDWIDGGIEPTQRPNPAFPDGTDVGPVIVPPMMGCKFALPYPAKRIGSYRVVCEACGQLMLVTTAGRADDPRSVTMICRGRK